MTSVVTLRNEMIMGKFKNINIRQIYMIILHINVNILILYNVYKMYVSCIFYKIFKYNYILLFLVVIFFYCVLYT